MEYAKGDLVWYRCVAYEIVEVLPGGYYGEKYLLRNIKTGDTRQEANQLCPGWGCRTQAEMDEQPTLDECLSGRFRRSSAASS